MVLDQLLGNRLSITLGEHRFGIEQVDMRGPARHEQVDDPFRLGGEVRAATVGHWDDVLRWLVGFRRLARLCTCIRCQQGSERSGSDPGAALGEKGTAGDGVGELFA